MDETPVRDMICNKADKTSGSKFDTVVTTRYQKTFVSVYLRTKDGRHKIITYDFLQGGKTGNCSIRQGNKKNIFSHHELTHLSSMYPFSSP